VVVVLIVVPVRETVKHVLIALDANIAMKMRECVAYVEMERMKITSRKEDS
jgi:hypothetical protein